ncbi:hypothetical protein HOM50_03000 [bacterium]|jgi:hypothetical protein|nr:hypothetical protein [bacterium]MBT5015344.1 hypothetical protein [bacterium]
MCCKGLFEWISIITVPIIVISFVILFPLSLMATGGSFFWSIVWVPLAALGLLSFVSSMTSCLASKKIWPGLKPIGRFLGWAGVVLVALYVLGIIVRVFGGIDIENILEAFDIGLLGLALLSTLFIHASIMRLFAFSQRALTYWLFWFVLCCHTYGIFYIFRVLGLTYLDGFMSSDVFLWIFIEAVLFSMIGTLCLFIYNNSLCGKKSR